MLHVSKNIQRNGNVFNARMRGYDLAVISVARVQIIVYLITQSSIVATNVATLLASNVR